jgi:hypothetical protein
MVKDFQHILESGALPTRKEGILRPALDNLLLQINLQIEPFLLLHSVLTG